MLVGKQVKALEEIGERSLISLSAKHFLALDQFARLSCCGVLLHPHCWCYFAQLAIARGRSQQGVPLLQMCLPPGMGMAPSRSGRPQKWIRADDERNVR